VLSLAVLGVVGCSDGHPNSHFNHAKTAELLYTFDLAVEVAPTSVAYLGWQAPEPDCAQAYSIEVSYEPALKFEDANQSGLILRRHQRREPYRRRRGDGTKGKEFEVTPGPLPDDAIVPGELFYRGLRAEEVGASRDFYLSSAFLGPASPMAGCFWRTWDPMEDAFSLGWPKLPGRTTAVGERWDGLRVEAQCSRAACVDPKTGGGGPDTHYRACVTEPFRESLAGIYEIAGERYALVKTEWDDGHDGKGISSTRTALISVDHGRPVWAKIEVDHQFSQLTADGGMAPIVRSWQMTAIDQCAGSLASLGWKPGEDKRTMLEQLQQGLETADDLRSGKKGKRTKGPGK